MGKNKSTNNTHRNASRSIATFLSDPVKPITQQPKQTFFLSVGRSRILQIHNMTSYWKTDLGSSALATSKIQHTNFETSFWLGNFLHTRHTSKNEHHFAMNRSCTHWHAGPDNWFLIFMFPRRTGCNPNTLRSAWRQVPAIKCHAPGKTQCGIYKLQWLWKQWQTRLELTGTAAAGACFCHKTQRYVYGNFRQWGTSVQPQVQSPEQTKSICERKLQKPQTQRIAIADKHL
jgi:hypothetical protein